MIELVLLQNFIIWVFINIMLLIIIGLVISYIYSRIILPTDNGSVPIFKPTIYPLLYNGMIIIPYNNVDAVHLHHWLFYFFICIISIFVYVPHIIIGFSFGLFMQGLSYDDCFNFVCVNPYN